MKTIAEMKKMFNPHLRDACGVTPHSPKPYIDAMRAETEKRMLETKARLDAYEYVAVVQLAGGKLFSSEVFAKADRPNYKDEIALSDHRSMHISSTVLDVESVEKGYEFIKQVEAYAKPFE